MDKPSPTTTTMWSAPRFALLLFVLIGISFPSVLFFGNSFVRGDFGAFCYPLAYYHKESFWHGEIPLWNPLSNCGVPFLAQWNTLVFYPLSSIYLLLPLPWSASFYNLVHLFIGGMGMFFLTRKWTNHSTAAGVAGISYAFCGLNLHSLIWMGNSAGLAWAPWVLFATENASEKGGRHFLLGALIGALQLLAGPPEIVFLTWIIASVLCLFRIFQQKENQAIRLFRFIGVVAFVTALVSVMLLPFFDFLRHGERDYELLHRGIPPWGLWDLFVPLFRMLETPQGAFGQPNQTWTSSYYLGISSLAFALLAVITKPQCGRIWFFAGAWLFAFFFAMGANGAFYNWLVQMSPRIGEVHFPVKAVVIPMILTPLLAALGFTALQTTVSRKRTTQLLVVTGILFVLIIGAILYYDHTNPLRGENPQAVWFSGISRAIIILGVVSLTLLLSKLQRPQMQFIATTALFLLLWQDGLTAVPKINPDVSPSVFAPNLAAAQFTPPVKHGESRISMSREAGELFYKTSIKDPAKDYLSHRAVLFANCNLLDNVPKVGGFYSIYLPGQIDIIQDLFHVIPGKFPEGLADFLSVAYFNNPTNVFTWDFRASHLPVATMGQKPLFLKSKETHWFIRGQDFDPRKVVCLTPEDQSLVTVTNSSPGKVLQSHFAAHHVELETEAEQTALLVLSQSYYHNWQATVDGQPVPILKANRVFQAVQVPAGHHEVTFVYVDKMFRLGATISALAVIGWIVAWFRWRPRTVSA